MEIKDRRSCDAMRGYPADKFHCPVHNDEENDIKEDFHNFLKKEINKKIEMLSNIKL